VYPKEKFSRSKRDLSELWSRCASRLLRVYSGRKKNERLWCVYILSLVTSILGALRNRWRTSQYISL